MDVVFTSLEALILKATLDCLPAPDQAALDAFCAVMRDSPEGPALAARALAARVQAGNPHEALLALTALDRCMRRCDGAFHAEIGKFRFLNEMIKLVSPKYYADRTAPEVQQMVLQLLYAWTMEYNKETKFKVAFDMLRSQGVVKETPPPLPPEHGSPPPPRPRAATFEDEEKSKLLQKLLRSKNPEDLQYANKLIKTMVREEERRTEADSRRVLEVRQSVECARLLQSLLEEASGAGEDERQLMVELEAACQRHHTALLQLAVNAQSDTVALEEILHAVDELTEVFNKYQTVVVLKPMHDLLRKTERRAANGTESLVDLAVGSPGQTCASETVHAGNKDLDALSDIFSTENGPASSMEPLKPVSVISTDSEDLRVGKEIRETRPGAGLAALDSLGAELLQQSLPGARVGDGFAGKSIKKIPMNAIEKTPSPTDAPHLISHTLDLDFLVNKSKEAVKNYPPPSASVTLDDLILDISTDPPTCDTRQNCATNPSLPNFVTDTPILNATSEASQLSKVSNQSILNLNATIPSLNEASPKNEKSPKSPEKRIDKLNESVKESVEVGGLSEVDVSLASVQASSLPPLTILQEAEGLTVVVHIATNRPRPDVNVLVLSTTSRHASPISDYKFHAVVPKRCKVRLLPASGSCLPPHSPFLQPAAIIQLMLIARPPRAPVSLKFVVTYTCNDDALTEMGDVPELPLDQL